MFSNEVNLPLLGAFNPCNGDAIVLNGTFHVLITVDMNPPTTYFTVKSNFQNSTGFGAPTGAKYSVNDNTYSSTGETQNTDRFVDTHYTRVIASGFDALGDPVPDFYLKTTTYTLVVNGVPVVDRFEITPIADQCR